MKKEIYRSYALVAQDKDKLIEIDWTRVKSFEHLLKKIYKLNKIDFFTSNYSNEAEIIKVLVESGILSLNQLKRIKLKIYPIKKQNNNIIYSTEDIGDLIYKQFALALTDDSYVIALLNTLIKDEKFTSELFDFYITNGKYNKENIYDIERKIYNINNLSDTTLDIKLQNILYGLQKQSKNIRVNISLIENICNYSRELNRYGNVSNELSTVIRYYVEEFYLRQKYYVTSYEETFYEKRILYFRKDKDDNRTINYLELHRLISFIQGYVNSKFQADSLQQKTLKKEKSNPLFIDGQLSLF